MIGEFLLRIATALEMNGIPYMLAGSLASSMYGIPRATNDIDIVIAPEVDGRQLTLATPEDVLLAKLEWAKIGESQRQLEDAAGILKMQRETLDWDYLRRWVDNLEVQDQWKAAHALSEQS
jgi:hypothetical protein